jgi:DNA repair ATPase RecN
LTLQFKMLRQINAAQAQVSAASGEANRLHERLQTLKSRLPKADEQKALASEIEALDKKTMAIAGGTSGPGFFETEPSSTTTLRSLTNALSQVERAVGSADVAPTADAATAFERDQQGMQKALVEWNRIKDQDVPHLNSLLKQAGLPPLSLDEERKSSAELGASQAFDDATDY